MKRGGGGASPLDAFSFCVITLNPNARPRVSRLLKLIMPRCLCANGGGQAEGRGAAGPEMKSTHSTCESSSGVAGPCISSSGQGWMSGAIEERIQ